MRIFLRLITGFCLVALYRLCLEVLKPFVNEIQILGGDSIVQRYGPHLIGVALIVFGLAATWFIHQIDKIGGK